MASFLTIAGPAQASIREKMSRFLAFAWPVTSSGEAREIIARMTNEYHDARHVCWAYMLGADRSTWQLTDNGEPSGTAGKPILGQINSLGLTNVLVIVVRYFGGIKLGTPGLIAAYRSAARLALEEAGTTESREMTTLTVTFPYIAMNDVMKIVKNSEITLGKQDFDNVCTLSMTLPLDSVSEISRRLNAAGAHQV